MQYKAMLLTPRDNQRTGFAVLLACLLCAGLISAAPSARASACEQLRADAGANVIAVDCGGAPNATLDQHGRLWVAFVQDQHVYVTHSDDHGETFAQSVQVNAVAEDTEFNGENRPKIIVADNDHILLSWTTKTSPKFTGEIRFTRSVDGGKTFAPPRTINDDKLFTGHRFESLFLTPSGRLYLTWIDKRDLEASLGRNEAYTGAAIYYAISDDLGGHFSPNFRVSNNSCECCRIAMAPAGDDNVAILWRQVFDADIRDHALGVLTPQGAVMDLQRATYDDWHIDACPHHGPTLVAGEFPGTYHMSWFSAGDLHQGIYYASYSLADGKPDHVYQVDGSPGAGHPFLARHQGTLFLVWKGFTGTATQLRVIRSRDNGANWSVPETLLETEASSDHPLLVESDDGVFLSWWTEQFGYLFQALDVENPGE